MKSMKLFWVYFCTTLISMISSCAHLATDYMPREERKGHINISMQVDRGYVFNVSLFQEINGEPKHLGRLRTGGLEIGDYKSISATASPGTAKFYIKAGFLSSIEYRGNISSGMIPFDVKVVENATTSVKIMLYHVDGGYSVDFKVDSPDFENSPK